MTYTEVYRMIKRAALLQDNPYTDKLPARPTKYHTVLNRGLSVVQKINGKSVPYYRDRVTGDLYDLEHFPYFAYSRWVAPEVGARANMKTPGPGYKWVNLYLLTVPGSVYKNRLTGETVKLADLPPADSPYSLDKGFWWRGPAGNRVLNKRTIARNP